MRTVRRVHVVRVVRCRDLKRIIRQFLIIRSQWSAIIRGNAECRNFLPRAHILSSNASHSCCSPPPPSLQKLISTVLYEFVQALSILCNQIICRNNWSTRPPSLRQAIWFAEQIGTAKSCLNILRWSWHLWILGGNFQTSIEDHRCQKNFFVSSWPLPKRFDSDESFKAQLTILIFVAIYALFGRLWVKNSVSWVRSALLHGIYCIFYWVKFANLRLREKTTHLSRKL